VTREDHVPDASRVEDDDRVLVDTIVGRRGRERTQDTEPGPQRNCGAFFS